MLTPRRVHRMPLLYSEASQTGVTPGCPETPGCCQPPEPGLSFTTGAFVGGLLHNASSFNKGNFPKFLSSQNDAV